MQALETVFAQVENPRVERIKRHRLRDIIILVIRRVIWGAEGWAEIEEFGKVKKARFTKWLNLFNRILSYNTFGRMFAVLDLKQFEASFLYSYLDNQT